MNKYSEIAQTLEVKNIDSELLIGKTFSVSSIPGFFISIQKGGTISNVLISPKVGSKLTIKSYLDYQDDVTCVELEWDDTLISEMFQEFPKNFPKEFYSFEKELEPPVLTPTSKYFSHNEEDLKEIKKEFEEIIKSPERRIEIDPNSFILLLDHQAEMI